jgi:APA family basic amino acid/polyamine antiporter
MSQLFTRKAISALLPEGEGSMKRVLGAGDLIMLAIGAVIGAGIFSSIGTAAAGEVLPNGVIVRYGAGPALVFSFILLGIVCGLAALCYAELASMIPQAGSAYAYSYATLGELIAWIIGWDLILEYLFGAATVAVGWSGYFVAFLEELGFPLSKGWTQAPLNVVGSHTLVQNPGGIINLPAVILVLLMTALLVVGISESAKFNNVIVFVKGTIVLLVIGFGFKYVNTANWHPFIPKNTGEFGHYGVSGVVRAAAVVFFAYIGFDAVSTAAQEAKNPQRDMPIGMLGSLAICTVLYILMALVMTGMVPYTQLDVPHPVFVAINAAGPALKWLTYLINIGAIAGLASVVLVMLMGQPRIFYSMSRDGLLPAVFGKVHPRFRTPYITTIVTGCVAALVAGFFPIGLLGELVSIGTLLAFVIVCGGVIYLRRADPHRERPFRTPMVPLVPILGILTCGYMMSALPGDTWLRLIIWMALGLAIYFLYSKNHSVLQRGGDYKPPEPTAAPR